MATCHNTWSDGPLFQAGDTITGVWNSRRYTVAGLLGRGANGEVYRVADQQGRTLALKVSEKAADIALEHKMLKGLQEVARGVDLGPPVFDLDDVQHRRGKLFFYVMELVRGTSLPHFVSQRGRHWTPVLLLQLCSSLERLHRLGCCFGDLKAENCLVDEKRGVLRLVDFGGVTPFGRGVKEYTEWYDRAWWGRGSRMAEESYDVFALSMLAIQLVAPELRGQVMAHGTPNGALLRQTVAGDSRFALWRPLLLDVWEGRVSTVDRFRQGLLPLVKSSVEAERRQKKKEEPRDWTHWLLIGSVVVFLLVICQFI
jgi:serine/threonine-protein kinase